jgi:magnesium-transporting ATPase (P-type)
MDNPFSWDYLTTRPGENEVFGPFAVLYLTLFAIGFVASIIVYNGGARKLFPNPVLHRMARKWAGIAVTIFGFGLFFFGIRALQITLLTFEMRIWMWLCILALFGLAVYIVYDYQRNYTSAMKTYEDQKRKQQYMRTATAGATAFPTAARPVKKRRR